MKTTVIEKLLAHFKTLARKNKDLRDDASHNCNEHKGKKRPFRRIAAARLRFDVTIRFEIKGRCNEVDGNVGIDEDVRFGDENAVHSKTKFRIVGYQD